MDRMTQGTDRRRVRRVVATAAASATLVAIAACSSSTSSGSAQSNAAGSGSSSSTLEIMTISSVNSPLIDNPDVFVAAQAAVKAINKAGGVNGHQIVLVTCNDQSVAANSQDCARQAVSDHVVAVVGQDDIFSADSVPILAAASIPTVGIDSIGNQTDFTNPDSYPLHMGSDAGYFAEPSMLVAEGKTRIATAALSIPTSIYSANVVEAMTKQAGGTYVGTVQIPPTGVTNYSSYAQQLKNLGADAVILDLQDSAQVGVAQADQALGYNPVYGQDAIGFGGNNIKQYASLFQNTVVADPFPSVSDTSNPLIAAFTKDLEASDVNPVQTFTTKYEHWTTGINAWEAVYAFAAVAKTVSGDITGSSLKSALDVSGKTYTLPGDYSWSPVGAGTKLFPQVSNYEFYYETVKNGELITTSGPHDLKSSVPDSIPNS